MSDKDRLASALEALKYIQTLAPELKNEYALAVYKKLTAPKMETVEVVRWMTEDGKVFLVESFANDHATTLTTGIIVKLTGTYEREVKEPKIVEFEGIIDFVMHFPFINLPKEARKFKGKCATVRVEEP